MCQEPAEIPRTGRVRRAAVHPTALTHLVPNHMHANTVICQAAESKQCISASFIGKGQRGLLTGGSRQRLATNHLLFSIFFGSVCHKLEGNKIMYPFLVRKPLY